MVKGTMTKKQVKREKRRLYLDGSLVEAIKNLQELLLEFGPDAVIDIDYVDTYSDSDQQAYYLYVMEEETDGEYQARMKQEEYYKTLREAGELQLYKTLKAKYESS